VINAITPDMFEWHESYTAFDAVTKFIAPDGTGHRGSILSTNPERTRATLLGLTAEYADKIVHVAELDADHWPVVVATEHGGDQ